MGDKVHVPAGTTSKGITNFEHWDLIPIKHMVENSRPERLDQVAEHWMSVKKELDAAAEDLKSATDHITSHWEGKAADGFAQRSAVLQESITNTGLHAQNTSHALTYAGQSLREAKTEMASIHVPSQLDRAGDKVSDLKRNDTQFRADIASGMDRDQAVRQNEGDLSLLEERHQQAIAVMERLAPKYTAAASVMRPPDGGIHNPGQPYPPPPDKSINTPGDVGPTPRDPHQAGGSTGTGNQQVGTNPTYRDPNAISGGVHSGTQGISTNPTHGGTAVGGMAPSVEYDPVDSNLPVSTGIDSSGGGTVTPSSQTLGTFGSGSGSNAGSGFAVGGSVGGSPGAGSGVVGGGSGIGGGYLGAGLGGGGVVGSRGGRSPSTGGRRTSGSYGGAGQTTGRAGAVEGQGRAGAGGMHGTPGTGGSVSGRTGGGSRGGAAARRGGGVIGASESRAGGAFTEGGSGLGRNRSTGTGTGTGRTGGPMPGAGASGQRKKDRRGSRPDYLVEDEDTWAEGNPVNPPVIE